MTQLVKQAEWPVWDIGGRYEELGVWSGNEKAYFFYVATGGCAMGQTLYGSTKATHAVRAELQRSKAPVAELVRRCGINEETVREWRLRTSRWCRKSGAGQADCNRTAEAAQ